MDNIALILIDVQKGLDNPVWGQRNNPDAEQNMQKLLLHWRAQQRPVIHIQHNSTSIDSPLRPESTGNAIKEEVVPIGYEPLFTKTVNSAFIGTKLEQYLRTQNIKDLVVVGLTTDHCISTSVRMAGNLGFNVQLVADATATFERKGFDGQYFSAEQMHQINLASLHGEFCQVVVTEQLLTL